MDSSDTASRLTGGPDSAARRVPSGYVQVSHNAAFPNKLLILHMDCNPCPVAEKAVDHLAVIVENSGNRFLEKADRALEFVALSTICSTTSNWKSR